MKKLTPLLLFIFLLQILMPVETVLADTGPKPTFHFSFEGGQVTIVSGILYECEQSDCSDAAPLEELGPQGFHCDLNSCSAMAYGFAPHHKIEIEFSDGKTRTSNIFETAGFDSVYKVIVRPDDLLVEAQINPTNVSRTGILILLCSCLLFGGGAAAVLLVILTRRLRKN